MLDLVLLKKYGSWRDTFFTRGPVLSLCQNKKIIVIIGLSLFHMIIKCRIISFVVYVNASFFVSGTYIRIPYNSVRVLTEIHI